MIDTENKSPLMSAGLRSFLWQRIIELLGLAICMVSFSVYGSGNRKRK